MSVAGVELAAEHRHVVEGDALVAAADDDQLALLADVGVALAIGDVEVALEERGAREGVVVPSATMRRRLRMFMGAPGI